LRRFRRLLLNLCNLRNLRLRAGGRISDWLFNLPVDFGIMTFSMIGTHPVRWFAWLLILAAASPAQQFAPAGAAPAQTNGLEAEIRTLRERPAVKAALQHLSEQYERVIGDLVAITQVPAPSFKEQARAKFFAERLREAGLKDTHIDEEGNVVAERPGNEGEPTVMLAAHLDTVFPEGTDVRVRKKGTIYSAPGVGDDSRGLAVVLAVARAMEAVQLKTKGTVVFVGDVGEEGLSNLRGTRYLFEKSPLRKRVDMFISLEGVGDTAITNGGVASKRYRVTFRGPGGHSFGAFGLVNPAFAMASAVTRLSRIPVSRGPKTTFNVGLYAGGTSVNSIPTSCWMEVDLRSESPAELAKLEEQFLAAMKEGAEDENRARSTEHGAITAESRLVGDRKGGLTPASSLLVRAAVAATRVVGRVPMLNYSSTDANVPMALGIPGIAMGAGGRGDRAHSPDEWVDVDKASSMPGMERALLVTLFLAGVVE